MAAEADSLEGTEVSVEGKSACDEEFEEIQMALEGISKDLGKRMDTKSNDKRKDLTKTKEHFSMDFEFLMSCGEEELNEKIALMTVADLDLVILVFEEYIRSQVFQPTSTADEENQPKSRPKNESADVRKCRARLNICFLEKIRRNTQDHKISSNTFKSNIEYRATEMVTTGPQKPKRYIVRASASPEEFENMTREQLKCLLRHHSVRHSESADQGALLDLVVDKVLQGVADEWKPPSESEIQWTTNDTFQMSGSNKEEDKRDVDVDETDWHVSVTVSNHKTMVSWDPIPLLKVLYYSITQGEQKKASQTKRDTAMKMSGYLDKLPVNQTKARAFKGWKRRFFKIEKGRIFYFEDHQADKPLGSLSIPGSKITVPGERMIQLTSEIKGDTIVLKCGSTHESKDWYRVLHEEAVPSIERKAGTSISEDQSSPTVIVDLGASTIRGGFASKGLPSVAFPAVYAVQVDRGTTRKFTDSGLPDPHLCTCGFDAFHPNTRKISKLIYPLRPSLSIAKYAVKVRYIPGFIEKVFQSLYISPNNATIIISCPQYLGDKEKEFLLDYLFGQVRAAAVYIQQQAVLALYSYSDTSGILVDIGDHIDVLPIVEGNIVSHGRSSLPYGGQQITESLSKLLAGAGYRFFSDIESYIIRYIKERCAFVLDEEIADRNISIPVANVDVKAFALPNKEKFVEVDAAQVKCTEGLFQPSLWGKDDLGLHKAVAKAIKACGIDERKELCRKIFLSGGTTVLRGLGDRLQKEVKRLLPDGLLVQVHGGQNRLNAAFKGASLLSQLPTFSNLLITREEWQNQGVECLKRWHQS